MFGRPPSIKAKRWIRGKALNDPIAGLSALGRQGVTFTESQKATIRSLVQTGDTLGAQKIILSEIEAQVGGSAEAYGKTLPGQLARANAAFDGVKESIVRGALPAFTGLLEFTNSKFFPGMAKAFDGIKTAFGVLQAAFKADGIKGVFREIGSAISDFLPVAQRKLAEVGAAFVAWVAPRIQPLLRETGTLLGKVVTYLEETGLPKLKDKLAKWGQSFLDWVGPRIGPLLLEVGKLLGKLTAFLVTDALPKIVGRLDQWAAAFTKWVPGAALKLVIELGKLLVQVTTYLGGKALDAIKVKVGLWAAAAVDWVTDAAGKIPAKFRTLASSVATAFTGRGGLVDAMKGYGGDLIDAIVKGVGSAAYKLEQKIKGLLDKLPGVNFDLGAKGDGPGRPLAVGGSTLRRVSSMLPAGAYVTSTYRTPEHNRRIGGSPTSYHLDRSNPAVDIGGSTAVLNQVYRRLAAQGGWRELLWKVPGHFDHVHVAHQGGMVDRSWPTMPGLRSDERPAILQTGERVLSREDVSSYALAGSRNSRGGDLHVHFEGPVYGADARVLAGKVREEFVRMQRVGSPLGFV